ncbi:5-oxoprolinase subunit PxpB [Bacillus sp. B1-b2]|nr:5-oxoprolinase subunit PxpB [Bacillus sp. B1-b2]
MGEQMVILQFEDILSIENNQTVQYYAKMIKSLQIKGVRDVITAMSNLTILYDPILISYEQLTHELQQMELKDINSSKQKSRTVHIPVVFDEQYGPDLPEIAKITGYSVPEIINMICAKSYYVYMIGFIAGLPYMGDLDERISIPRKANPRIKVPKGTVAIANRMTDIYTMESPGGWHLVGWTPMEIFDVTNHPPNVLLAGDFVKYEPITAEHAKSWNAQVQKEWDSLWNI